jgi:hypothetical protein
MGEAARKWVAPAIRTEPAKPLLSVCLTTYNRRRYLDNFFTRHLTAFDMAGIDYEMLVSDNASTDDTPDIIASYAKRHKAMRVVRQPTNIGGHGNVFYCYRKARGEIVVHISDDDLLVPEQVLAYTQRLLEDPALNIIYSPWFLTDETKDNAVIGQFYHLDQEQRFEQGQFGQALEFVINRHVFPECLVIRGAAVPRIIHTPQQPVYNYFVNFAQALACGDVLFAPEPHVIATAVSAGDNEHVGNRETMESWDRYRGGLEYLASFCRRHQPGLIQDWDALTLGIHHFTATRMSVAERLNAGARNWQDAHYIRQRMTGMGFEVAPLPNATDIPKLAAMECAMRECEALGYTNIVVDDRVSANMLSKLKPKPGVTLHSGLAASLPETPRALLWLDDAGEALARPQDHLHQLMTTLDRFMC